MCVHNKNVQEKLINMQEINLRAENKLLSKRTPWYEKHSGYA
jgi:hypothetical protein